MASQNQVPAPPEPDIPEEDLVIPEVQADGGDGSHEEFQEEIPATEPIENPADNGDNTAVSGEDILSANLLGGAFSLHGGELPEITSEESAAVTNAIKTLEGHGGACGFVIVDMESGQGLSYNPQWAGYCASTAKGLFAYYLLDRIYMDETVPAYDADALHAALAYSDNDSYDALVGRYYTQDFIDWLWQFGIYHDLSDINGAYPYAASANMAAAWASFFWKLSEDTDAARFVSDALSQTEVSFIRNGVSEDGWTVRNKGGWIDEYANGENATNDSAIIEKDGRRLVLSIVSSAPYTEESAAAVSELAKAVLSAVE